MTKKITINIIDQIGRIDAILAKENLPYSRTTLAEWLQTGYILVNGVQVKRAYKVTTGDTITILPPEVITTEIIAEDIPLDIIYEDDDILVVNKPQGMVVHPAAGHSSGTLVNALLFHAPLSTINGEFRPGIVHRIDRDTSGLLMVAKNDQAHQGLSAQLKAHKNDRIYYALVRGEFVENSGTINAPINRHKVDRKKQAVQEGGREAITHFEVIERYVGYTLLKVRLETGRTHQIRVHMTYIGHPVVGDPVYGSAQNLAGVKLNGQMLHAKTLSLTQPKTGEELRFDSALPAYFKDALATLTPIIQNNN
ncbi:RluA family pseudouridine synthase [Leuconostoc gasicomitatum]|uniref:RluA family pseudouridine synthase n=1 Tax=Leuconostoc gasicomitatum TaxID=115778 RepID=UPI001CC627B2|nr:RluA family pseudouridine synthase [Leuconostoc gasicomitatum]MBZ5955607.1 RluA family pseudouridine synthase [Leuconostoc gasicomitatum]